MKRKGFTLIELLAVIVILAIIALITTPMVMKNIEKSKKSAVERSAENYIRQVNAKIVQAVADGNKISAGKYYIIPSDGNLCSVPLTNDACTGTNANIITVDMSGSKPDGGILEIDKSGVSSAGTTVLIDDNTIKIGSDGKATIKTPLSSWVYVDSNADGTINSGDTITFGTENFYIYKNDTVNEKIYAIAQYNLYVGGEGDGFSNMSSYSTTTPGYGLQNKDMKYDNNQHVYKGGCLSSQAQGYADNYKSLLIDLGVDSSVEVRIITKVELDNLGVTWIFGSSNNSCGTAPTFITSAPGYWIYDSSNSNPTAYISSNSCGLTGPPTSWAGYGTRPVVVISASDILQ